MLESEDAAGAAGGAGAASPDAAGPRDATDTPPADGTVGRAGPSPVPLLLGSALALAGALLLLVRWLARRRGTDRLLR